MAAGSKGFNLAVVPLPFITRLSFMSIPTAVTMMAAMSYYSDFLKCQSNKFYDPTHIEEFDFIIGNPFNFFLHIFCYTKMRQSECTYSLFL